MMWESCIQTKRLNHCAVYVCALYCSPCYNASSSDIMYFHINISLTASKHCRYVVCVCKQYTCWLVETTASLVFLLGGLLVATPRTASVVIIAGYHVV